MPDPTLEEVRKKSKVPSSFLSEAVKALAKNGLEDIVNQGSEYINDLVSDQGYDVQPEQPAASSWGSYDVGEQERQDRTTEPSTLGQSQFEEYLRQQTGMPTNQEYLAQQRQLDPIVQFENSAKEFMENYVPDQGFSTDLPEGKGARQVEGAQDNSFGERIAREVNRRLFDENGNLMSPLDWNILGFTSQQRTDPETRNIYEQHFRQEEEDMRNLSSRPSEMRAAPVDEEGNSTVNWNQSPRSYEVVGPNDIDDGTPGSREALYMTGDQYARYREEYGIPGRPVSDIQLDEIYNKQEEMDDYGFIPYLVSDNGLSEFHDRASVQAVNGAFNDLANLRRNNVDFTINYNGETYSGQDFLKNAQNWSERNRLAEQSTSEDDWIVDPAQATEYDIPYTYMRTNDDGTTEHAYGEFKVSPPDSPVLYWEFPDGRRWEFESEEDFYNSISVVPAEDGDYVTCWRRAEPLVLDSGQVIRADIAHQLLSRNPDTGMPNWDQYADYGYLDFGKPYVNNPLEEGGFVPWLTDMFLQSSPLFFAPTAAAQATSKAFSAGTGFEAGSDDYLNNTYSMLSENPTEARRNAAVIGSLLMPATERLLGIGSSKLVSAPIENAISKVIGRNINDVNPVFRIGLDAASEAAEEIPGNFVENLQQADDLPDFRFLSPYYQAAALLGGMSGRDYPDASVLNDSINSLAWINGMNVAEDEYGNKLSDSQGHPIYTETPYFESMRNFAEDIPLSALGGATLGGLLSTATRGLGYLNTYNQRRRERNEYGNNLIVDLDGSIRFALPEEQRDYYNR